MKGLMYVRVSIKEQVERTSLDSQVRECRNTANKDDVAIPENVYFVKRVSRQR